MTTCRIIRSRQLQLPRTQITHSKAPNPHASNASPQNFRSSYWHSYPEHNLHTARLQTRMPATHPHKLFAPPIGAATPTTIYTQQGPKPACQQHIHTKFSQLLLAQLPQTQFTHSKAPNPHASNTSTQNFRSSYWHSYPKQHLRTARPQTRVPATHPHKIFAAPIGTATPNNIYTQHGPKPACQQHIHTKFSQLLLAQLPRTQFTHSKAPNPHASNASTQNFRSSYWRSYPEHNLHTARLQTRMPVTHPHKIFAPPIGTATPNTIYIQQGAKPECQQHISTNFSHLLLAQLPGTQFTHSKAPYPHASNTSTQNFRSSYWRSYPEHNLHTARRQTPMAGTHQDKIFAAPIGTATPNTIYTQQGAIPACQEDINTQFSQLLLAQPPQTQFTHSKAPNPRASKTSAENFRSTTPNTIYTRQAAKPACQKDINTKFFQLLLAQPPRTQFTHSKPPNPHARKTSTQNFCSSYCHSHPKHNLHTARRQTRMPGRHQHKIFAAPIGTATPNTIYTRQNAAAEAATKNDAKAYIRPTADAPSPTPATQKQRQSRGDKTTPKRTSDPLQMRKVPRLPRKSSDRAAETKRRQSVHQTHCRCSKSHACHAKAAAEPRRPNDAKAYIGPPADAQSPTPATQKQQHSGGDQTTPKRTSDPLQMLQVPRLPRKSSDRAAETKRRQSVHQTPCRCSKPHAYHAKAAAERRRLNDAKAYIRPTADAPSPTPATQKQRQRGGDQTTPKRTSDPLQLQVPRLPRKSSDRDAETKRRRTSDPLQMHKVPRLPRESSDRAAETKRRQSVHQTPCRCTKSHACHVKATAEGRRPNDAKAYIRPPADAPSPTPATQKQRQSGGDQTTPKRTSDPLQMLQVPRLPRKSSGRAAETKRRQSVHRTPCRCAKSHACHARKSSDRDAETKRRQSVHRTPCRCTKCHACHAKAAAEQRRPNDAKAYIRPPADAPSPTPATQKQRQSSGDQTTPKRTSDPLQMHQAPRLPRKSSGTAATKNDAKAYIRPP